MTDQITISRDLDAADVIGIIHPLGPKVRARAERVVRRNAGDHPADELLDILGLTEETS